MRATLAASLALVAASSTHAQSQLIVADRNGGPGTDFIQISAAVAAANDGDTILVRSGKYAPAVVDGKSLTIVADEGAGVDLRQLTVESLEAGQRVLLRNIDVLVSSTYTPAAVFSMNAGEVWAEDCDFTGRSGDAFQLTPQGGDGIEVAWSAGVTLVRTNGTGGAGANLEDEDFNYLAGSGGYGLSAADSNVTVWGGTMTGGFGGNVLDTTIENGGDGGHGIRAAGGTLFASGVTAIGRNGGFGDFEIFSGCGNGGNGGDGIALTTGAAGYIRDATLTAGLGGGPGLGCFPGLPGSTVSTLAGATETTFLAAHQSLTGTSPVREGQTLTLSFTGEPFELAFFRAGATQTHVFLPTLSGTSNVDDPAFFKVAGLLSASGTLTKNIPLSDITDPGTALTLFLQGVFFSAGTESFTLTGGSAVTLLDATD